MHANAERHEAFLRSAVKDLGIDEVVYVTENAYDGGYEVRVGTHDFFIDYDALEEKDTEFIRERLKGYVA